MRTILAVVLSLAPAAAPLAEPGTVDWQKKVVRCTGTGAPNLQASQGNVAAARIGAERAARLDALRNCLEGMKGVKITSAETVGGAIAGDAALRSRVEGVVKGFQVVGKPRYFSDGGVELDVEVPLDGVGEVVLPPARDPAPAAREAAVPPAAVASGLLVDARGSGLQPALAPRLVDEKGLEVYSATLVAPEVRKQRGVAAWAKDPEVARKELAERLGDRPLLVKARGAQGSDLQLSDADAAALRSAPDLLAQARVVIVTD
jgi:hypothetical protein